MKVFWSVAAEKDRAGIVDGIGLVNPSAAFDAFRPASSGRIEVSGAACVSRFHLHARKHLI